MLCFDRQPLRLLGDRQNLACQRVLVYGPQAVSPADHAPGDPSIAGSTVITSGPLVLPLMVCVFENGFTRVAERHPS